MFKVEVIADNSGKWAGNGLRFRTKSEANAYGHDLYLRWTLVREWRIIECEVDPADVPAFMEKNAAERVVYNADGTTEVDYDR